MSFLQAISGSKIGTRIGSALLVAAGVLQAAALDPWSRERYPWLGVAAIICTGIGTPLAATGRALGTVTERRVEDPPSMNTHEMRAVDPPEPPTS